MSAPAVNTSSSPPPRGHQAAQCDPEDMAKTAAAASAAASLLVAGGGTPAPSSGKAKNSNNASSPDWSVGTASTVCSSSTPSSAGGDGSIAGGSFLGTPTPSEVAESCDDRRRHMQNDTCSVSPTTSVVMMPPANDDGNAADVNLMQYLGQDVIQRSANDPHVEMVLRAFERRVYLSKKYTNTKEDKDGLKKVICNDAQKRGMTLHAICKGGTKYPTLEFHCRDGVGKKKGRCALNFTLRWDGKRCQWYVRVGSGCPQHSAHKPIASADERQSMQRTKHAANGRKKRRMEGQYAEHAALAQFDLASGGFQGGATTRRAVTAAAMAATVPKSKASGDGTCYLCIPVGATNSNRTLELATCACDSFQLQHYWLGPAPKISVQNATSANAISADNGDGDIEKTDDDTAPPDEVADIAEEPLNKSTRTQPRRPPFENGINRRTKRIDELAAKNFNSGLPFFDQLITKPSKALKAEDRPEAEYQDVAFSGYSPNSLPGSQTDVKRKLPLFRLRKGIIKAGKNVHGSIWMEEAESFFIKSSSKYYTLLLRDHTEMGDISKSGICSMYFRPLENTKYWWLSYLTTVRDSTSRRGYGTLMMWRMINLARRAEDIDEIWLEVQPDLEGVQQMYQRLGFEAMEWDDLPADVANYEMEFPDVADPHKTKKERVYKHWGEFVLMRLDLSIFPPLR